jgi:hypothetical protein
VGNADGAAVVGEVGAIVSRAESITASLEGELLSADRTTATAMMVETRTVPPINPATCSVDNFRIL